MGQDSAFYGDPPLTQHDANIMVGLFGSTKPPHKVPITEPGDRGPGMIIGLSFAIGIIFIVTVGRLMTRAFRKGQVFGADDWVIIPAMIIVIAYLSQLIARVPLACAGKHINYCTYKEIGLFFELGGIGQVMFFAAANLIKISMTLFNRRLTGLTSQRWQYVHYSFLALLVAWFFISLFINIFQCQPVTAFFNFSLQVKTPSYHCLNSNMINYSFVIINAITDFCLLCVPVLIIVKVRMKFARKVRLLTIFCLGSICCITSVLRIIIIHRVSKDFTWRFPQNSALAVVDIFFGSLIASLPALNAFAELAWTRTKTYYYSSHGEGTSGSRRSGALGPSGASGDPSRRSGASANKGGRVRDAFDDDTQPSLASAGDHGCAPHGVPMPVRSGSGESSSMGKKGGNMFVSSADSFYTEEDEEERIGTAVHHPGPGPAPTPAPPSSNERAAADGQGFELKSFK